MKNDDNHHNFFYVGKLIKVPFTKDVVVVRNDAICFGRITKQATCMSVVVAKI